MSSILEQQKIHSKIYHSKMDKEVLEYQYGIYQRENDK
jgi:hypothetical protein